MTDAPVRCPGPSLEPYYIEGDPDPAKVLDQEKWTIAARRVHNPAWNQIVFCPHGYQHPHTLVAADQPRWTGRWRQHPTGRERPQTDALTRHLADPDAKQHKRVLKHIDLPAHQHP